MKSSPVARYPSLITVRDSQINWCSFCVDINSMLMLRRGSSEEKLADLANCRDSDRFTQREKAALHYAEIMTFSDRQVTNEDRAELRRYFDEDAIIELTAVIAFQNLSSKFNAALDVPAHGFCQKPPSL